MVMDLGRDWSWDEDGAGEDGSPSKDPARRRGVAWSGHFSLLGLLRRSVGLASSSPHAQGPSYSKVGPSSDADASASKACPGPERRPPPPLVLLLALTATSLLAYWAGQRSGSSSAVAFASEPLHSPATDRPARRRRAFVCITGQLPRLELDNKIEHLLRPWTEEQGIDVDVALVLSDSDRSSVHRKGRDDLAEAGAGPGYAYPSVADAAAALSVLPGVTVVGGGEEAYDQTADPVLSPVYLRQRGAGSSMNETQLVERVRNHVRQFESLAICGRYLMEAGLAGQRGPGSGGEGADDEERPVPHYDLVHRVRDDSGYYRPVDFDHVHRLATGGHPRTVVSSHCAEHSGINDRGSFVAPLAAYDYFVHPLQHMYTMDLPAEVRNTEQFLMVTYARTCRLVQTDAYHLFRLWGSEDEDEDGAAASYSDSDLKCIREYGLDGGGEGSSSAAGGPREVCHRYSDGYRYCVDVDQAGLTYELDGDGRAVPLPVPPAGGGREGRVGGVSRTARDGRWSPGQIAETLAGRNRPDGEMDVLRDVITVLDEAAPPPDSERAKNKRKEDRMEARKEERERAKREKLEEEGDGNRGLKRLRRGT